MLVFIIQRIITLACNTNVYNHSTKSMYCQNSVQYALCCYYLVFRLILGITYAMLVYYTPYFVSGDSNNGSVFFFMIYEFHRISRMVRMHTRKCMASFFLSFKQNTNLIYTFIIYCTSFKVHYYYYDSIYVEKRFIFFYYTFL